MGKDAPQPEAAHGYVLTERLRRHLGFEAWNIGVVDQPAADIVERGLTSAVRWLPARPGLTALADPAYRRHADGRITLYAEHLDHRRSVGEIWSATLDRGADLTEAQFRPLLVRDFHMSYPFPIEDEHGRPLLTAETWQAGAALLWDHSNGVNSAGTLMPDRFVVDPTLWRSADRWWLFCTFRDDAPDEKLHAFHALRLGDPWTAHVRNPIKIDRGSSRPAGPIFRAGDLLVRPGQDCSRTYGGAVVLNAITRLTEHEFEERTLRRLVAPPGPYPHGLHTICPAGEVTLVDGKRWTAHPQGVLRKLILRGAKTARRLRTGQR